MHIIKAKDGLGLPTVLGIVTFLIGITATFLSYIVFQSRLVDLSLERTESYINAVQRIETALHIIERDGISEQNELDELARLLDISIESDENFPTIYNVFTELASNRKIMSRFTGSGISVDLFDELFKYKSESEFDLSDFITPTNMLAAYMPTYFQNDFDVELPQTNYDSFDAIFQFIQSSNFFVSQNLNNINSNLIVTGHWIIEGDVRIRKDVDLTILDNNLLFINGNLILDGENRLFGNIVVNGNVTWDDGKNNDRNVFQGTIYADGIVSIGRFTDFGTLINPSFIFAEKTIFLDNNNNGYIYILANEIDNRASGNTSIIGGVYAMTEGGSNVDPSIITSNQTFYESYTSESLYDFAIPSTISVASDNPDGPSTSFIYTQPKLS